MSTPRNADYGRHWGAAYLGLVVALTFQDQAASQEKLDAETACRVAVVGYGANRSAFPFFTCRYTVTRAEANTFSDAFNGKWINASSSEHRQIVDGDRELIECLAEMPKRVKPTQYDPKSGVHMTPMPFMRHSVLTNGEQEISHSPSLKAANLFNSAKPGSAFVDVPWSMGLLGHHRKNWRGPDAMMNNPTAYDMTPEGLVAHEGKQCVAVRFVAKQYNDTLRFVLDPSQGYLPLYISSHYPKFGKSEMIDGHPRQQCFLTRARPCSKDRWFPDRFLLVSTPDNKGGRYSIVEFNVTEFDADTRPSRLDFSITIPAGTTICSDLYTNPLRYFSLQQEERIGLEELPSLFAMLEKAQPGRPMDTAIPRVSHLRRYWWAYALTVPAGLVVFWVLRRVRRARSEAG